MSEFRPIIMRSNRLLGAALVEGNLISVEQLEEANEKLLQIFDTGSDREVCLLNILMNQSSALTEQDLYEYMIEDLSIGLIDLREIDINDDVKLRLNIPMCWATWSVPFDRDDDVNYIASAYVLSPAVKQFWEKQLGSPIVWFGATLDGIGDFLEKLESERAGHSGMAMAS